MQSCQHLGAQLLDCASRVFFHLHFPNQLEKTSGFCVNQCQAGMECLGSWSFVGFFFFLVYFKMF